MRTHSGIKELIKEPKLYTMRLKILQWAGSVQRMQDQRIKEMKK